MTRHFISASAALSLLALAATQAPGAGINRLDWSVIASPQFTNQPFGVTLTARDDQGQLVPDFTGPVSLTMATGAMTRVHFQDNFEDGTIADWTAGSGTNYIRTATNGTAALGERSLTLIGGSSSNFNGLSHTLANLRPAQISFHVRASTNNANGGYFVVGNGAAISNSALFFYMRNDGTMGLFANTWYGMPYTPLQWYKITMICDWALQRVNLYTNNVLAMSNVPFRNSVPSLTVLHLYNYANTQAWWDEIQFLDPPPAVSLTPATTGTFVDGAWTGTITVRTPATNLVLEAADGAGHTGTSNPFDVMRTNQPPVLLTQPADLTVSEGNPASFAVSVYGAPPLSFQWRLGGTNVAGGTNAALTLNTASNVNAGNYTVVVTNRFGAVTSSPALLTVLSDRGFTDDFEPGIELANWSAFGGTVGTTVLATNYGGSVSGVNSLWFGANGDRLAVTRVLNASVGGTVDFNLRLADGSQPWEAADLPEEGVVLEYSVNGGGSWLEIGRYDSSTYTAWTHVTVDLPAGAQTTNTLVRWRQLQNSGDCCDHWALDDAGVIIGPRPPGFVTQPVGRTAVNGWTVTLEAQVSGTTPLTYQWRKDGVAIPGATSASYVIASAQPNDSGVYSLAVTNAYGWALSANATLTVLDLPPTAEFRIVALKTNNSRVVDHNALTSDDRGGMAASATRVFYSGDSSTARFALADLSGGTALGVIYDALVCDLRSATVYSLANGSTPLSYGGTANRLLEHDGNTGALTGSYIPLSSSLTLPSSGVGFFSGYGFVIVHTGTRVFQVMIPSGVVIDHGAMTSPAHSGTESWAYWGVAESFGGTNYLVYVRDSATISRTAVPSGATTTLASFSNLGDMASFTLSLAYSRWYFHYEGSAQFGGTSETVGYADAEFSILSPTNPPVISIQPTNVSVAVGHPAGFQTLASSSSPLSYQWRKGATAITDATNASYTISSAQTNDAGSYSAVVTNRYGSVTSSVATLTVVLAPPTIVAQPADRQVAVGRTANFQVTASGAWPLFYQWRKEGVDVSEATNATFSLPNVQTNDGGGYSVVVTNSFGAVTSTVATLTVLASAPPSVLVIWDVNSTGTAALSNALAAAGLDVTLSATSETGYTGTNPAPDAFEAVIHLNGTTYSTAMPAAGRTALVNYVQNGGGFLQGEWNAYEVYYGQTADLRDLTLLDYNTEGAGALTVNVVPGQEGHPVLGHVPSTFSFQAGHVVGSVHAFATNPATVLMRTSTGGDAVAVREFGFGRVVGFLHAGNFGGYNTLSDPNVQQLYVDGVLWAARRVLTNQPPAIFMQPQSQTVMLGSVAAFNVTAYGPQPLSYQWRLEGTNLPGATSASLTLSNVQTRDAGNYSVVVSNLYGPVVSSNATLTVLLAPPSILTQPADRLVAVGRRASFQVIASGALPLFYQWRKEGLDLVGETNASFSLPNVQTNDAGHYSVRVTNSFGGVTSTVATLTVLLSMPTSVLLIWDTNGPGTLALSNALDQAGIDVTPSATDETAYDGSNPTPTGFDAVIHLNGSSYAAAMPVAGQDALVSFVQNGGGFVQGEWDSYEVTGSMTNMRDLILFDFAGNAGPLTLVPVPGQESHPILANVPSSFTFQAGHTMGPAHVFATNPVTVLMQNTNGSDAVAVREFGFGRVVGFSHAGNYDYGTTNNTLSDPNVQQLYIDAVRWAAIRGVSILAQPTNRTVLPGMPVAFSVTVAGTPPFGYQWRKDGAPIPGATNATLLLAAAQVGDAGRYWVTVTNRFSSTVSAEAFLKVVELQGFADDFEPGIELLQWAGFDGTVLAADHGGSMSGANALWFGGNTLRQAVTRPLNVTNGGWVEFSLRLADGATAAWEMVDLPDKGVVLEFSTNGGSLWIELSRHDTAAFYNWTTVSLSIPAAARSTATQFRWRQLVHDGECCDHWALDDVAVVDACTRPVLASQPATSPKVSPGSTAFLSVKARGPMPLAYRWLKNGLPLDDDNRIAGTASPSLWIAPATEADAGSYSVMVSNACGATTSSIAALAVQVLDHFAWSTLPTVQTSGVPFAVTIAAQDALGNTDTSFAGSVALTGLAEAVTTNVILGSPVQTSIDPSPALRTCGYAFTPNTELQVTHIRHLGGDKVTIWTDSGLFLAAQNLASTPGAWQETALATPVPLLPGVVYRLAVRWTSAYWSTNLPATFADGTLGQGYVASGDAFPADVSDQGLPLVDLRYQASRPIPVTITPASAGVFAEGVWTGEVTVPVEISNLVMQAESAGAVFGLANPIDVMGGPAETALGVSRLNDIVRLSWPAAASGFVLETCTNLAVPAWTEATNVPVVIGSDNVIEVSLPPQGNEFYRLKRSGP